MFSPEVLKKLVARWPDKTPLCLFGGNERFSILPVAFTRVSFRDCYNCHFSRDLVLSDAIPFQSGLMGLLNYTDPNQSYILQVSKSLVIDWQNKELLFVGAYHHDEFHISEADISTMLAAPLAETKIQSITLQPRITDEEYLVAAEKVLEEIRNGRFYQLNLLRYFGLQGEDVRASCLDKFNQRQAQMSMWVQWENTTVASFSPERFVRIHPEHRHYVIDTFPVKGTTARHADKGEDVRASQELLASPKDRAELAMIIDLMRNDFYDISKKQSIQVKDQGSLLSNAHIHHLQGHIQAQLRDDVSFGELVTAVFPAGSITGAPKKEVMKAIKEYEGRDREFFMGAAFYWDARGFFDSSVLIRTAVAKGEEWEFAAGSGLVIKSDPQKECEEIKFKCEVIIKS